MTGGGSGSPDPIGSSISADGRYVTFSTKATGLVSNDVDPPASPFYANGQYDDAFLRDRASGTTTLISRRSDGAGAAGFYPSITPDAHFVVFTGYEMVPGLSLSNEALVYDMTTGTTELVGLDESDQPAEATAPAISADGNVVVFQNGDTTALLTADTPAGSEGRVQHLYARNRSAGTTVLVDVNGPSFTNDREPITAPSLSSDGRYVAFNCWCQRSFPGDAGHMGHLGVYRADLVTRTTLEADANKAGAVAHGDSGYGTSITANGASILFGSFGGNLVPGDNNGHADIFVSTPH